MIEEYARHNGHADLLRERVGCAALEFGPVHGVEEKCGGGYCIWPRAALRSPVRARPRRTSAYPARPCGTADMPGSACWRRRRAGFPGQRS